MPLPLNVPPVTFTRPGPVADPEVFGASKARCVELPTNMVNPNGDSSMKVPSPALESSRNLVSVFPWLTKLALPALELSQDKPAPVPVFVKTGLSPAVDPFLNSSLPEPSKFCVTAELLVMPAPVQCERGIEVRPDAKGERACTRRESEVVDLVHCAADGQTGNIRHIEGRDVGRPSGDGIRPPVCHRVPVVIH